jgi:RNA 2',3'-cyclic 3'-phosphodiesterase
VDESRLEGLRSRVAGLTAGSFTLQFDRIEFWREARVLVATCPQAPAAGVALSQSLQLAASELGLAPDRKAWRPHVTLARSVLSKLLPAELHTERRLATALTLSAGSFVLAESLMGAQQRRYATLERWPLR